MKPEPASPVGNAGDRNAPPRLIADIGGTNARFALHRNGTTAALQVLHCADYPNQADAVEDYLGRISAASAAGGPASRPRHAAIAVACPVAGDRFKLTNNAWQVSIEETRRRLGFTSLQVVNDFTALALALPALDAGGLRRVGGGSARPDTPLALLGPGTGLGVSGLIPSAAGWLPLAGEGGHVTYGSADAQEAELLAVIRRSHRHVSAERLLSGPGLQNIYLALTELGGNPPADPAPAPAEITRRALSDDPAVSDPLCVATLNAFCAALGTAAGNLVLTLGARGGVYIGGGIVPRLGDFLDRSPFRSRFETRGRFSEYLAGVPSYVITAPHAPLLGAARLFDPLYRTFGHTSRATGAAPGKTGI